MNRFQQKSYILDVQALPFQPRTIYNTQDEISLKLKKKIKGQLLGLRQFLVAESPLKMIKNAFYFMLKALFVLKIQ